MKLPRFIAPATPSPGSGLARATDIGALTRIGPGAELITQAGRAISGAADIGFKALRDRQALDDITESGVATQRAQESWNKAAEEVGGFNPQHDMPLPDSPDYLKTLTTFGVTERDQYLNELLGGIEKDATKIFSGIKNPKTKARLVNQYNEFYADRTKALKGELDVKLNNYQLDEMTKLAEAAALNGNMDISDHYVNLMAKYGLITRTNATKLKKGYAEQSGKAITESLVNQVHAEVQAGNFGIAALIADSPEIPEKQQTVLRNLIEGERKEAVNFQEEVDRDGLGKALNDGTISYNMIDGTSLDEKEQESYRVKMETEAKRKATGKPIVTNQSVKGDIEREAYKIWMGAIEKGDYDKLLEEARYGKTVDGKLQYSFGEFTSDVPLINDSDYDILRSLGAIELKTTQAKGLSESSAYAKGQIVEVDSDISFARLLEEATKPEQKRLKSERKLQLDNWSQFNRSMKLWQAENPDAVEGDYYIESRRKLPFYISRTPEDIVGGKLPLDKLSPEDLRKMNTKEAYDKGVELGYWK